ncbi:MAG: serine/threonine protein kinase [Ktedonobacteraceae bacterium]
MANGEEYLTGQTLKKRYIIEGEINRDAMGVVYLVWDHKWRRPVAIKVLRTREAWEINQATYALLLTRFNRERSILLRPRHPHIVSTYDAGQYAEMLYFVMKYCLGGSLAQVLQQTESTASADLHRYIAQAASALDYIHARGIVHRDIKPHNFLLDRHGNLLLTDFGIAHIIGSTLATFGQFWGTEAYASPEAKRSEKPDPHDDIYSLGVVLYQLVTRHDPTMLHQLRQGIPPGMDRVISRATATRRQDHYASADVMVSDVAVALEEEEYEVQEHVSVQTPWTARRKWPACSPQRLQHAIPVRRGGDWFTRIPIASRPHRFNSSLGGLLVLLIAFAALIFFAHLLMNNGSPSTFFINNGPRDVSVSDSPTPSPLTAARVAVQDYYQFWIGRNYQAAYDLLQVNYRQHHPFSTLLADYEHTQYACVSIDGIVQLQDGVFQVMVTDNAIEEAPSEGGVVTNQYRIVYVVDQEQDMWKLALVRLALVSTHGSCHAP